MKLAFQRADMWSKIKTGCSGKINFALAFASILNGFTEVNDIRFLNYITCVSLNISLRPSDFPKTIH